MAWVKGQLLQENLAEEDKNTYTKYMDESWKTSAACKKSKISDEEYSWFFPPDELTGGQKNYYYRKAIQNICRSCPVREACLEYAMKQSPSALYSVWGGKSGREIQRYRKRYYIERGWAFPPPPVRTQGLSSYDKI